MFGEDCRRDPEPCGSVGSGEGEGYHGHLDRLRGGGYISSRGREIVGEGRAEAEARCLWCSTWGKGRVPGYCFHFLLVIFKLLLIPAEVPHTYCKSNDKRCICGGDTLEGAPSKMSSPVWLEPTISCNVPSSSSCSLCWVDQIWAAHLDIYTAGPGARWPALAWPGLAWHWPGNLSPASRGPLALWRSREDSCCIFLRNSKRALAKGLDARRLQSESQA